MIAVIRLESMPREKMISATKIRGPSLDSHVTIFLFSGSRSILKIMPKMRVATVSLTGSTRDDSTSDSVQHASAPRKCEAVTAITAMTRRKTSIFLSTFLTESGRKRMQINKIPSIVISIANKGGQE